MGVNETASIRLACDKVTLQITYTGGNIWYMSAIKVDINGKWNYHPLLLK